MNGEPKQYLKAIGIVRSEENRKWLLALAEKTPRGVRIGRFSLVSDAFAIPSEAEKLAGTRLGDEQNPVMISAAADTAQVGFYPFSVPLLEGSKLEALISAQAEAIVPMPLGQTAFTWRMVQKDSTVQRGFLLGVRKGYFQELAGLITGRVGSILPDATGLVRAWAAMFESTLEMCLLVQVRQYHCVVAMCEQEKLVRAAAIDWEGPQTLGTLANDLLNLLETLNVGNSLSFYITGPQSTAEALCEKLIAAGKTARLWTISNDKIQSVELTEIPAEILHCPEAAGIALAALEEEPAEFDLIRQPKTETTAGAVWDKRVLMRGLGLAAAVLVLFYAVLHWTAQMEIKAIEQALTATHQDTTGQKILARQQMRERIAAARPDMSYLMTALNACVGNDVLLDSFSFKKGQPVRIVAKTGSFERVYAFQKKMQEQAGISDVKLISPTMDEKRKQVQFTITFAYRSFSR